MVRPQDPTNRALNSLHRLEHQLAAASVPGNVGGRALTSPEVRAAIFDEIRTIVREELARMPFSDRLMDVAEAAERMGMTEAALRKAAARDTIPCEHRGRRPRFRLSVLMGEAEARPGNQGAANAGAPPASSSTLP